jgi:Mor family transcriptional regulator
MRRRERSIYSQRKKLYEEYQRLGSVEAFNKEYRNMSIGKVYALISSRSRSERTQSRLKNSSE